MSPSARPPDAGLASPAGGPARSAEGLHDLERTAARSRARGPRGGRMTLLRIATGRDYRDAMPVSGIRQGVADERLDVLITVEQ